MPQKPLLRNLMFALVLFFVAQGALGQSTGLILPLRTSCAASPSLPPRFREASFLPQSTCPPSSPRPATRAIRALISFNYYDESTFWKIFDRKRYLRVKKITDPQNPFRDIYAKTCSDAATLTEQKRDRVST